MLLDYRGLVLVTLSLPPETVRRLHAVRARRGYRIYHMARDAINTHLDALEGLEPTPIKAPARFKRAMKRRKADEKSIFAPLIK
jgi:hypothetical protein